MVGVGMTSTDSWSMWVSIGRPVGHGTILERESFADVRGNCDPPGALNFHNTGHAVNDAGTRCN